MPADIHFPLPSSAHLEGTGIAGTPKVSANLRMAQLVTHAIRRGEARFSESGALIVRTGVHTGRSAQDKFVVDEPETSADIWWGKINQRLSAENFALLKGRVQAYLQGQELYVQDFCAGADPANRLRVRMVTTGAWPALFARNIFLRPPAGEADSFQPDFVVLHAPQYEPEPSANGLRSSTVIALSFAERMIIVAGTEYAGEIKKSVFTTLNWLLPPRGVLPMHCSANIGPSGDVALFFGLSGTGKTTLASESTRRLIGDDEHGWGPDGVFNFEGGCYAKVINLSEQAEPEIWAATHRFGTVLENVVADAQGRLDLHDKRHTENTRACYPLQYIPGAEISGRAGQPRNVLLLTADAFGVLPPIAKLSPAQAMYHFLSGYTARLAGTEKGLSKEPRATFSTCFAAPFLPRRPSVYARMLTDLIARHDVNCWLVNTGWTGGPYGIGERISIQHTRALVRAALDGTLAAGAFRQDRFFGLQIPQSAPDVPDAILDPRRGWADKEAYDLAARDLLTRFERNFHAHAEHVGDDVKAAALRAPATAPAEPTD
jgi:phosphoenolpyruvate carboxykinase (ATP)